LEFPWYDLGRGCDFLNWKKNSGMREFFQENLNMETSFNLGILRDTC